MTIVAKDGGGNSFATGHFSDYAIHVGRAPFNLNASHWHSVSGTAMACTFAIQQAEPPEFFVISLTWRGVNLKVYHCCDHCRSLKRLYPENNKRAQTDVKVDMTRH
jgi:hypothetical protein